MIKKLLTNIINRLGIWRSLQLSLICFSTILIITAISQWFIPINSYQIGNTSEIIPNENILALLNEGRNKSRPIAYRAGMFKPATGLQDKPIADKTIEKIKQQLKVKCVLEMNGQPVAYINIQGAGLKKCGIGDNINDLFTVLNIDNQNKSVDVSIVGHKVTLLL